jgi:hypothetical protein
MSVRASCRSLFASAPSVRFFAAATLSGSPFPTISRSAVRAHRRGVLARNHASAYQKEFALEQALRKAETPK